MDVRYVRATSASTDAGVYPRSNASAYRNGLSAEPGCRGDTTMSVCPAVSAQKSGEPTHARTSPVRFSSTTTAA